MTYLWDNYIQFEFQFLTLVPFSRLLSRLSSAQRIILIGHGAGCGPLTQLLEERSRSIVA